MLYWKLKEETYSEKEKEAIHKTQEKRKNITRNEEPQMLNKNQDQGRKKEETTISFKETNREDKEEVGKV